MLWCICVISYFTEQKLESAAWFTQVCSSQKGEEHREFMLKKKKKACLTWLHLALAEPSSEGESTTQSTNDITASYSQKI